MSDDEPGSRLDELLSRPTGERPRRGTGHDDWGRGNEAPSPLANQTEGLGQDPEAKAEEDQRGTNLDGPLR